MKDKVELLEEFFIREIEVIVENMFKTLKENNINVNLEKENLKEDVLKKYNKIYKQFEIDLLKVKNNAILKFGNESYLNILFSLKIEEMIKKKNYET